jgi:cardiolipin synthase
VGQILDPIADKATQFTLIVCLSIRKPVLWILVCLFFIKECFQLIAAIVALRHGQMLKGAHISGKICTTVLFVSLIVLVMMPGLSSGITWAIMALDCIALLFAFVCYARAYYTHSSMILDLKETTEE